MRDNLTKKYSNGEITVVWKPDLCTHSAKCWKELGSVFNPKVRPWIKMDGADSEQIRLQVGKCPSGALSLAGNEGAKREVTADGAPIVEVSADGPLNVSGMVTLKLSDGSEKLCGPTTSLCRCGQSDNKPFCDGSHETSGFKG